MYKMVNITKETLENNDIKVIADSVNASWPNEKNIEEKLGQKTITSCHKQIRQNIQKKQVWISRLTIKQPNRRSLRIDLALKIIMDWRTDKSCSLKNNIDFKLYDAINTKKQTMINSIKDAFEGESIQTQYSVLGYKIDLYVHEYKLAIEVDELRHADRNINNEIKRQKALENKLNCVFIRINPNEKDFNIFKEINKIHGHIKKSF